MTTITRKEYNAEGTEQVLGLPCTTWKEKWDGTISADSVHIQDAFNIDSISIDESDRRLSQCSASLMSFAARVASVRLQHRMIFSDFTAPRVNGIKMQYDEEMGEYVMPEGEEWKDANALLNDFTEDITVDGTTVTPQQILSAVSDALSLPCKHLWKMSEEVSYMYLTDAQAMLDGRATMVGYPVEGAADVAWVALTTEHLQLLAQQSIGSVNLLKAMLIAMGMDAGQADYEVRCIQGNGTIANVIVSENGIITIDPEDPLPAVCSRMLMQPYGEQLPRPWITADPDGLLAIIFQDNPISVYAVLAEVARKSMDSLLSLAMVGVCRNGVVTAWMIKANKEYGVSLDRIFQLYTKFPDIEYSFTDIKGKRPWLYFNGSQYIKTGIYPSPNRKIKTTINVKSVTGAWMVIFGGQGQVHSSDSMLAWAKDGGWGIEIAGSYKFAGSRNNNVDYDLLMDKTGFYVDNILTLTPSGDLTNGTRDIWLGALNRGGHLDDSKFNGRINKFIAYEENTVVNALFPYKRNDVYGFLDIITDKFYTPDSGSFTYTLE